MIVESIGRLLYSLVPSSSSIPTTLPSSSSFSLSSLSSLLPTLSVSLMLAGPVVVFITLLFHLWPMVARFRKRIRQVDDLPGPRSTSIILGNVPAEMLKSLITGADHKKLIISKLAFCFVFGGILRLFLCLMLCFCLPRLIL